MSSAAWEEAQFFHTRHELKWTKQEEVMRHARADYNRIQDPAGLISEEEPVFLLRAQDRYAAETVLLYSQNILADELATPEARALADRAYSWAQEMRVWGVRHGIKYPDMPDGA